jgi:hypothetical protein
MISENNSELWDTLTRSNGAVPDQIPRSGLCFSSWGDKRISCKDTRATKATKSFGSRQREPKPMRNLLSGAMRLILPPGRGDDWKENSNRKEHLGTIPVAVVQPARSTDSSDANPFGEPSAKEWRHTRYECPQSRLTIPLLTPASIPHKNPEIH